MRTLDVKLLRDLWRLRGHVVAVALVVASGVALLVMSLSALTSLSATTDAYYQRQGFAEVFAGLKRAPERLATRIGAIPGVQSVETRITAFATIDLEGAGEPVSARLVSLPAAGREPLLNRPVLRAGRMVDAGRDNEAVLHAPFAEANGLMPGDSLSILMNGKRREVRVVGLALSPEYVYAIAPGGLMPDDRRFGVIWMAREALAAAYDMDGAFNDVSLSLLRGVAPEAVIASLDPLLARYGGTGAVARADQVSNWFLQSELAQLRTMATILPTIFLAVAAFLTNAVLARLITTERREISLLKAFGYSNAAVGWHYAKLALAMALVGVFTGWALGAGLGRYNTELYSEFFRFPFLQYRPSGAEFATSAGVALAAALAGAGAAVRRAVNLPPAEAMRPPAPTSFRTTPMPERLARRLDTPTRIVLRQIARTPLRSLATVTGVALAVAVLVTALQWSDAIRLMVRSQFFDSQRQHMTIAFHDLRADRARHDIARLPGVMSVEPMRVVRADLRAGARLHRGALTGLPRDASLRAIHDVGGWTLPVPPGGVAIGSVLAAKLGVSPGDRISVEALEGGHPRFSLEVAAVFETWIEMPAIVDLDRLNREMGDPPVFGEVGILVDPQAEDALFETLREIPGVSAVAVKRHAVATMFETLGETILIFTSFFVVFACALAAGVTYNATRIALSERARELATLRVLGFTRWEISYILIGETALLLLAGLPLGCLAGWGLALLIAQAFATELYRVPLTVLPPVYGTAVLIVVAAGIASAALVRRRLDRLDLIAVLKTRE